MRASFSRSFPFMALLVLPWLTAAADDVVNEGDRLFRLPEGGGVVAYFWHDDGDGPQVGLIEYSGDPEWLARQEHPRSHWHKLPALDTIDFRFGDITEEQMEYVASLDQLRVMYFEENIFHGDALAPLADLKHLEYLQVDFRLHMGVTEELDVEFFHFIDKLERLEYLTLWHAPIDEDALGRITSLEQLVSLDLDLIDASPEAFEQFANLSSLRRLSIHDTSEILTPVLKALRGHPRLATFQSEATHVDDEDVAYLASLPSLEHLFISGETIGLLDPLENATNLKTLTMRFDEYGENDFGWLSNAPQLEELTIWGTAAAEVPLEPLRGHEGLKVLQLPDIDLSEEDMANVESLPNLETLLVNSRPESR